MLDELDRFRAGDDVHCKLAKETDLKVAGSTDAHAIDHLEIFLELPA